MQPYFPAATAVQQAMIEAAEKCKMVADIENEPNVVTLTVRKLATTLLLGAIEEILNDPRASRLDVMPFVLAHYARGSGNDNLLAKMIHTNPGSMAVQQDNTSRRDVIDNFARLVIEDTMVVRHNSPSDLWPKTKFGNTWSAQQQMMRVERQFFADTYLHVWQKHDQVLLLLAEFFDGVTLLGELSRDYLGGISSLATASEERFQRQWPDVLLTANFEDLVYRMPFKRSRETLTAEMRAYVERQVIEELAEVRKPHLQVEVSAGNGRFKIVHQFKPTTPSVTTDLISLEGLPESVEFNGEFSTRSAANATELREVYVKWKRRDNEQGRSIVPFVNITMSPLTRFTTNRCVYVNRVSLKQRDEKETAAVKPVVAKA